jgi:hypothetical protein
MTSEKKVHISSGSFNISLIVQTLKESVNLVLKKPIIFIPVILTEIILTIINYALKPWLVELFDWFWINNLTYVSTETIAVSAVFQVFVIAVTLLSVLVSLDMAKTAHSDGTANFPKSTRNVIGRLLPLLILSFIAQILILTIILIPIGLLVLAIAVIDANGIGTTLSKAINFFRKKPIDIIILAILLFAIRVILSQVPIPHIFELSVISDILILIALQIMFVSQTNKPPQLLPSD